MSVHWLHDIRHGFLVSYANRVKLAAISLALCVSLANAAVYTKNAGLMRIPVGTDRVSMSEKRFKELKGMLPVSGSVGYVSDVMLNIGPIGHRDKRSDEEFEIEYALTQYALSPVIVDVKTEGHDLVVGNFHDMSSYRSTAAAKGLTLVRDFGHGIMLFSKANE